MKKHTLILLFIVAVIFSACSGSSGTHVAPTTSSLFSTAFPGIDTVKFYPADGHLNLITTNPPIRISSSAVLAIPYMATYLDTTPAVSFNIVISDTVKYQSYNTWKYYVDIRQPGADTLVVNGSLAWLKSSTGETYCELNVGGSVKHRIQSGIYYGRW